MYLKLSFKEINVSIPGEWGGLLVTLVHIPVILNELPENIAANTAANISRYTAPPNDISILQDDSSTYEYDYYLDCDKAELLEIENAIIDFHILHEGRQPSAAALFNGPDVNPIILYFRNALKPVISPFNLFQASEPGDEFIPFKKVAISPN